MKKYTAVAAGVLVGLLSATGAQASTYYLNLTNLTTQGYPDYQSYIKVDISQPTAQQIQFTVSPQQSIIPGADLMGFGFNMTSGSGITTSQITAPMGWSVNGSGTDDGFGTFQFNLKADNGNNNRLSTLQFDINLTQNQVNAGVGTANFVANSTNATSEQDVPFVAHVANLVSSSGTLTGFIGGPAPVPVPAALWLFGSGLVGLVGIARRRPKV